MAYVLLPNTGESLDDTRDAIKTNFTLLQITINANHVSLTGGDGKHKFLQMPEQASAPTTAANEGGLYVKAASSISNLFWRQESDGTEIQMTNIAPSSATSGYSFLPGGILMQWGQKATPGASGQVMFPITFSAAPYSLTLTLQRSSGTQSVTSSSATVPTATTFNYLASSAGSTILYWMAIGPKV